ncbi:vegetative cell wall protein gp1-like [Tripterygium wilfordii]|uniref:vegetative cell wall protein gp1-like n=1 Tax=Tripterygium wilfordii TaxID=458696 RepID=UPI0018F7F002|nr:vegetative cell wall protein gp1-like [Tripterygium wilfordii]
MKNSAFVQVILVAVLVMSMNVQFGLAQLQNPLTCFSNFNGVRGCIKELTSAFSSGKADNISPACCKVVNGTSDFCLLVLFPNPATRTFLKLTCSLVKDPPASAPAPAQTPAAPSTTPTPPQPSPPSTPTPSQPSPPTPSSPSQPSPSQPSTPSAPTPGTSAAPAPKAESAPAPSG